MSYRHPNLVAPAKFLPLFGRAAQASTSMGAYKVIFFLSVKSHNMTAILEDSRSGKDDATAFFPRTYSQIIIYMGFQC